MGLTTKKGDRSIDTQKSWIATSREVKDQSNQIRALTGSTRQKQLCSQQSRSSFYNWILFHAHSREIHR